MFKLIYSIVIGLFKAVGTLIIHRDKNRAFITLVNSMANHNIFYVKIFQSFGTNTQYFNTRQREFLLQYLDKVPFKDTDVNHSFKTTLVEIANTYPELTIDIDGLHIINSGIIGIVYKGKMGDKDIIVKVIKNQIGKQVNEALADYESVVNFLKFLPFLKYFYIEDILQSNKSLMLQQLNFSTEVAYIQKFECNNRNTDYVKIPTVYEQFTTLNSDIIVMEYLEGKKINDLTIAEKDKYLEYVVKFGFKSLFFNKIFHADLHAGNIIFMNSPCRLGIIDFGVVGEISKIEQNDQFNFCKEIFVDHSYDNGAKNLVDNFTITNNNNLIEIDKAIICAQISDVLQFSFTKKHNIDPEFIYEINKILYKGNMKVCQSFCKIELSFAICNSVCNLLSNRVHFFVVLSLVFNKLINM